MVDKIYFKINLKLFIILLMRINGWNVLKIMSLVVICGQLLFWIFLRLKLVRKCQNNISHQNNLFSFPKPASNLFNVFLLERNHHSPISFNIIVILEYLLQYLVVMVAAAVFFLDLTLNVGSDTTRDIFFLAYWKFVLLLFLPV